MHTSYSSVQEIIITEGLIAILDKAFPADRLMNTDLTVDDIRIIQGQQSVINWLKQKQQELQQG